MTTQFKEIPTNYVGIRKFASPEMCGGELTVYTAGKTIAWEYNGAVINTVSGVIENGVVIITKDRCNVGTITPSIVLTDTVNAVNQLALVLPELGITNNEIIIAESYAEGNTVNFTVEDVVYIDMSFSGLLYFRVGRLQFVAKLKEYIRVNSDKVLGTEIWISVEKPTEDAVSETSLKVVDKLYLKSAVAAVISYIDQHPELY